jgi:hypothetical protein
MPRRLLLRPKSHVEQTEGRRKQGNNKPEHPVRAYGILAGSGLTENIDFEEWFICLYGGKLTSHIDEQLSPRDF